ncbi:MAG: extracellular solute-binding protein [Gammaproteobacteria bacterium]|nr:extracellular solute-binding protein [Gammaproteobacteria bacterium]
MRAVLGVALAIPLLIPVAGAATGAGRVSHALAMHGAPKYPADFAHFEYVNPDAPKGGTLRLAAFGTFDSFNPFIPKGNPGPGSSVETLLTHSADEPFTAYGLLAETLEVPDDRSWVIFNLRPEARWHDGEPVTADDVVWSFQTLTTKGHPSFRFYYQSVSGVEKLGPRRVKFTFSESENRELPLIVGDMPVLPKHYWESRDFESTTLEPPLGSGPYRVAEFEPGRFIVQARVDDYWGRDLAVNRGRDNFARIRYDYYRDETVIREAIKAGEIDFHRENQAKAWALGYEPEDVPPIRRGWLNKERIEHHRPTGMQAFFFNTRRGLFADRKVREALGYAFDFEWTNENLFFGEYTRTESFFSNSELASSGLPGGEELEILERYRGRIPEEIFTEPFRAPTTDASGWPRGNLSAAFRLLAEAGWEVRDLKLVNTSTGQPMRFEILLVQKSIERIVLPFVRNLQKLGIDARVRLVDTSQYINRLRSFDFDMIIGSIGQSDSPGNEQRSYWSSAAADAPGARNYAGIRDPVVDELIELVISAPTRESLVARTRALDRVLLAGHYVIPHWHLSSDRILYWDKFSRPAITPDQGTDIDYWWFDEAKATQLRDERGGAERVTRAGESTAPHPASVALVAAVLVALGYVVFRRAMGRRTG